MNYRLSSNIGKRDLDADWRRDALLRCVARHPKLVRIIALLDSLEDVSTSDTDGNTSDHHTVMKAGTTIGNMHRDIVEGGF